MVILSETLAETITIENPKSLSLTPECGMSMNLSGVLYITRKVSKSNVLKNVDRNYYYQKSETYLKHGMYQWKIFK